MIRLSPLFTVLVLAEIPAPVGGNAADRPRSVLIEAPVKMTSRGAAARMSMWSRGR